MVSIYFTIDNSIQKTVCDWTLNVNLGPKIPATKQLTKSTIWSKGQGMNDEVELSYNGNDKERVWDIFWSLVSYGQRIFFL